MANWYIQIMGETLGPLSAAELHAKATKHQIESDTLVRKGSEGEWVLASKVEGLLPEPESWPPQPENPNRSDATDEAESVAADVLGLGYERQPKQGGGTQEKQDWQGVPEMSSTVAKNNVALGVLKKGVPYWIYLPVLLALVVWVGFLFYAESQIPMDKHPAKYPGSHYLDSNNGNSNFKSVDEDMEKFDSHFPNASEEERRLTRELYEQDSRRRGY